MRRRRLETGMILLLLAGLTAGCGGDGNGIVDVEPDPDVEPFIGTWDAETMTVTSVADTSIVADLIEIGGAFTLNVQESGQYTAQLSFAATDSAGIQPFVEIGRMSVSDDFVTLTPTTPAGDPVSSEYEFVGADFVRLEGPTDFDFNLDDTSDPAILLLELQRR